MHRRSSYRPVGQEAPIEPPAGPQPQPRGGHGRRRRAATTGRRRKAITSAALGVAMTGVLVSVITAQGMTSEAAPTTAPDVLAAMGCVRGWLADPAPTVPEGAACFAVPTPSGGAASLLLDPTSSESPSSSPSASWSASSRSEAPLHSNAATTATAGDDAADRTPFASATPTASPTKTSSSPTATPDRTASASASASASADPGSDSGFGSAPASEPVSCQGRSGVTISGHTFKGIGNDRPAIVVNGCSDVVIRDNDFIDDAEPIYVVNSRNVRIIGNRYRNITGPHTRNGSHRGNFTQWENSFGGEISDNVGVGGDTEDVVSIYKSGGISADQPLVIQRNVFRGSGWTSSSGSGFMLGDGGGSHVLVRNNTLIDVGQVGIGVAGGSDIRVQGNTILGSALPNSNVGIYVWAQGAGCSGIEVSDNRIDFKKQSGIVSPLWDGGNCGTVAGWASNTFSSLQKSTLLGRLDGIG